MAKTAEKAMQTIRISPGGMVTLPFSAMYTLGFGKEPPREVGLVLSRGRIQISRARENAQHGLRVSASGLLNLTAEAHQALTSGKKGRCQVLVQGTSVYLMPRGKGQR